MNKEWNISSKPVVSDLSTFPLIFVILSDSLKSTISPCLSLSVSLSLYIYYSKPSQPMVGTILFEDFLQYSCNSKSDRELSLR